jgi:hypothetical protein
VVISTSNKTLVPVFFFNADWVFFVIDIIVYRNFYVCSGFSPNPDKNLVSVFAFVRLNFTDVENNFAIIEPLICTPEKVDN